MKRLLKTIGILIASIIFTTSIANAQTILFPFGGGTGTGTPPTYGKLLVGNAGGTYTLTGTSSLGLPSGTGTSGNCVQWGSLNSLTDAGSACGTGSGGGSFPFTTGLNFNQLANATGTQIWFRGSPIALSASGTSIFANASSSIFSAPLAYITKLSNLPTNGFVKTSNLDGTLSVDTNTYLTAAITSLNGLSGASQTFATTTNNGGWGFSSSGTVHTLNIPTASATNVLGLLSSTDWSTFNNKQPAGSYLTAAITALGPLNQTQTGATQTLASSTTGTDFTITASGNTQTFNLPIASASNTGKLSNTDWSTFNNKQSTISATWPITLSGANIGFNGLSTSTALLPGGLPYNTGANTFGNVATTSVTCSGSTSCSSFTVIGPSPITISSSGGGGSGIGTVSTSSQETAGQVAVFGTTNGYPAKIYSQGTSTATISTGLSYSGTWGNLIGGVSGNLTNTGVISNSCTTITCSGTNPSSFSIGNGAIGFNQIATSTLNANQLLWFNASTGLVSGTSTTVTVGSLIATTSTASLFNGNVAIGTSTGAYSPLVVTGGTSNGNGAIYDELSTAFQREALVMRRKTGSTGGGLSFVLDDANVTGGIKYEFFTSDNQNGEGAGKFFIFNSTNARYPLTVTSGNLIGIATNTPQYTLNPFSSAGAQLSLSNGAGQSQFFFRNAGGNLYSGTTTTDGTATTTLSAFTITGSNGNTGIASSTPGSLFSIGTTNGINFGSATSTWSSTGGINLTSGCFAINGTCIGGGGSGTVTGVTGTWPIISSGGATPNITWGGFATSSPIAAGAAALYATGVNTFASVATSTPSIGSVLTYTGGTLGNFLGGTSGTFGIANTSITNGMLANSTISGISLGNTLGALTATNPTLTFSGSYTGTAAQTVGLNLGNANSWTALQQFNANASSSIQSILGTLYVGKTATSTILGDSATSTLISSLGVQKTSGTAFQVNDQYGTNIMNVGTASTTPGYLLLSLSSATSTGPLFGVDQYGHVVASSTVPTLSSCGTSPSLSTDSGDFSGTITVGSVAATACTLTFGTAHVVGTHCVISEQTGSVTNAATYTESLTGFTYNQTGLTSNKLDYICMGR